MSIYYKSLLIFDKEKKTARKIDFKKGINIVTSKRNSVGKTSLSLMILHSFGAKVKFSDKWNMDNIFTKLTLLNDSKEIDIIRHKDTYTIVANNTKYFYPGQKYGYTEKLYEVLGLTIKIKDKNSDSYSTAIPSLYLLPYFLSQTKTNEDRSVFEDLNMYIKTDLYDAIYYHVGALDNQYSHTICQQTKTRKELEELKKANEKYKKEIQYLESKLANHKNAKTVDCDSDLNADIKAFERYSRKKKEYYILVKKISDLNHKIELLNNALKDNAVYTAKLLDTDDIFCPECHADITDFISTALKVGIADADINAELADLKSKLLITERRLATVSSSLEKLRSEIDLIEQQRKSVKVSRAIIVWNEALAAAKESFSNTQQRISSYEELIKEYSDIIRKYGERKSVADKKYRASFGMLLNATNVNTDGIDISDVSLYGTLNLSGSEIPRVAISRFFALLESKSDDSIVMPIIFDFPNLDMTEENLTKCFKVMCDKISDTRTYPQSFIFSIDCEERISKAGATLSNVNTINLESLPMDDKENPQLLCKHDYNILANEINAMINA